MSGTADRELFHYFKQYTIDRIIGNCKLTRCESRTKRDHDQHKHHGHHEHHGQHEHRDHHEHSHQRTHIVHNLVQNTTIVASPSKHDPDYWYEWVRDSAIVVNMLIDQLTHGDIDNVRALDMMSIIRDYVSNHLILQKLCQSNMKVTKNDCKFIVTLGEPKFNTDLTIYDKPWGRPQNDGPALRAIAMIKLAKFLLNRKVDNELKDADIDYVKTHLYDSKWPDTSSLIKRDLEYTCYEWSRRSFDLWEEIEGYHFYTLMVQHKALVMGAELALMMDDRYASDFYRDTAKKIHEFIRLNFYRDGRIVSSIDVVNSEIKERYIDSSILLGFIHTNTPFNEDLINTMADAVLMFHESFEVNRTKSLMLIGRYHNDKYYGGNPWVLTTAALAFMLMTMDINKLDVRRLSDRVFKLFGLKNKQFKKLGMKIVKELINIEEKNEFTGLSFAEQIDKDTLMYKSADRLTWNYVEIVRVLLHIYR